MNVYKNARITPRGRVLLVERIESGVPVARAATAAGCRGRRSGAGCTATVAVTGLLHDRSSAPHR